MYLEGSYRVTEENSQPSSSSSDDKNVLLQLYENALVDELERSTLRAYISKEKIEEIAIEKYRSNGNGIMFRDVITKFSIKKRQAQRSLKHFHASGVLFTAEDLICQGIDLVVNKNPQQYFPTSIKAEILNNLRKRKTVLVEATGVSLPTGGLLTPSSNTTSKHPLCNTLEYQKAQSFLDVLMQLPFALPYIHKLQLMLFINKEYFDQLPQDERPVNRAKPHEEIIGRRHVTYTFSPNGTIQVSVKSSATPFRLATDEDETDIYSFLGQVRDRLLHHVSDIRERQVPAITDWILKQCDLNKDIEISDKAQITLPDIQLRSASRVFRLYVKSLQGKAVCRSEESLTLNNQILLLEALDNIRHPYKLLENKLDQMSHQLKQLMDLSSNCKCKSHG
jgi:hypothetical protein